MEPEVKVHFIFDKSTLKKRLKWKDIKLIRKIGDKEVALADSLERIQTIACRFMVNENNEYMPFDQAFALFDEFSQEEAEDVLSKFTEAVRETAVPNGSGTPLPLPSEASSTQAASLAGS